MDPVLACVIVLALVAVTTAIGLRWRSRQGRIVGRGGRGGPGLIAPADVATDSAFGSRATLLQFSTEFCARCPGTRALLSGVAGTIPGVAHVDVDLTRRRDLAARFSILATPTTFILDGDGRVRARVAGVPNRAGIIRHLSDHLTAPLRDAPGSSHVDATL